MSETISNLSAAVDVRQGFTVCTVFHETKSRCFFFSSSSLLRRYDYVEVYNGGDEASTMVGKFCGKIAPSPIISSGGQLLIKFVSDYETHGAGFSVRYEVFKTGAWPLTPG